MGFTSKDYIDQALIKKYSRVQVDNPSLTKNVDPEEMLSALNCGALMQKYFVNLNIKVNTVKKDITDIPKYKYSRHSFQASF